MTSKICFLALLCLSISGAASASESICDVFSPTMAPEKLFEAYLSEYARSYVDSRGMAEVCRLKMVDLVFQAPVQKGVYESRMRRIDQQFLGELSEAMEEAYLELATALEKRWDREYLPGSVEVQAQRADRMERVSEAAFFVGSTLAGLAFGSSPSAASYLAARRIGIGAGIQVAVQGAGYEISKGLQSWRISYVPSAPVQLLALAPINKYVAIEEDDLLKVQQDLEARGTSALVSTGAAVSVGALATGFFEGLMAMTPESGLGLKIARYAVGAGAAYVAWTATKKPVEETARYWISAASKERLRGRLRGAITRLAQLSDQGSPNREKLEAFDELVRSAYLFEAAEYPGFARVQLGKQLGELALQSDLKTCVDEACQGLFQQKGEALYRQFDLDMRADIAAESIQADPDLDAFVSRNALRMLSRNLGTAPADGASYAAIKSEIEGSIGIRRYWGSMLEAVDSFHADHSCANQKPTCLSRFQTWLDHEDEEQRFVFSSMARQGILIQPMDGLLFELSSFVKSLQDPLLSNYADDELEAESHRVNNLILNHLPGDPKWARID